LKIEFQPIRLLPHPDYNKPKIWDNDVALVFVQSPGFLVTPSVRPICLWDQDYDFNKVAGSNGQVKPQAIPFQLKI